MLTAPGRSAIAVVAVAGPEAVQLVESHFQAVNGRSLAKQSISRIVYGHWDGESGEDLIVCRRVQDEVEIHCHGGTQSVVRIIDALTNAGCEEVNWPTWIAQRTTCPLMAEAQVALASATTVRTATILLQQFHGALSSELDVIRALLDSGTTDQAKTRLERLLGWSEFGLHLTRPWRVVIAGLPNVGKSSLINALVGYQRAIVFDQPGTTRDVVTANTALNGWPVQLSDTAGLHATGDEVEAAGVALAREQLLGADLVVWLLDATKLKSPVSVDKLVAQQAETAEAHYDPQRALIAVNKCDLAVPPAELSGEFFRISATVGTGVGEMIEAVARRLVPHVPLQDSAVPFTEQQVRLLRDSLEHCRRGDTSSAIVSLDQLLTGRL